MKLFKNSLSLPQTIEIMIRFFFTTFFFWGLFTSSLSAKIWINELMQSNIDLVRDDLQEFPDSWIELYNDSDQAVNIQNWTISDDANIQNGWKITRSVVISPKSYILIYADKASQGLHTHFRLDSGSGGALYLFDASGNIIDMLKSIPKQIAPNIAWGRIADSNDIWANFVTATPGSKNIGATSSILLPPPVFSQPGGIYKNAINISFSLPANAPKGIELSDIYYTLDNSEPTLNSPYYTGGEILISKTTVVRAKLINPNNLTNRATVHTYIISSKDLQLPVISISTDNSYLWDDEFGIYCRGNGKYGLTGNGVDFPANWNNDWRRPINFEYFDLENKASVLNQLCEMRIAGGWTRANPQKSFIVYGQKRFGIKRFEYDFFKEKPNQEIKSFMIRNSGNDFWYTHFRDAAIQLFMGSKVDIDYQAYQPAIFYLNGNYWGIQNLRERSEEDFVLANYGIDDNNVDVIASWWGELNNGDRVAWNQLMNELRKSSSQRNIQWINDQVDIDEFFNYMILQIYVSNTDFPHNNMSMWRPRTPGGKWRFILKDLDFGLGIWGNNKVTHNTLIYNTENNNDDRKLFNALLSQDSLRKKFYSAFAIYMGDLLHYTSTSQVIDSIQKILEPSMQDHLNRWMPEMWWRDMNSWRSEIASMKTWCYGRNVEVYKHLRDYFRLGTIMSLSFEVSKTLTEKPTVYINNIRMRNSGLNASYFQREIIDLRYEGNSPSYVWRIIKTINGVTTEETRFEQNFSYQIADGCTSLIIRLIDSPTSISNPELPEISLSAFNNQLEVTSLHRSSEILIYDINGKLITKTFATSQSIIIPFRYKGIFIVKVQNEAQNLTQKVAFN